MGVKIFALPEAHPLGWGRSASRKNLPITYDGHLRKIWFYIRLPDGRMLGFPEFGYPLAPCRWGGVLSGPIKTRPSPCGYTMPNLTHLDQTVPARVQRSAGRIGPLAFPHFKVTEGHRRLHG